MVGPVLFLFFVYAKVTNACPYLTTRRLQGGSGQHGGMGGGFHGGGMGMENGQWEENGTEGMGMGQGGGGDMPGVLIQELLNSHSQLEREVTFQEDGSIRTRTTTSKSDLVGVLQNHVSQMQSRVQNNRPVRHWDPFFAELFERREEYRMDVTNIDSGVEVVLTATTSCGQSLIELHAATVTLFVTTGREEARKSHDVPASCIGGNIQLIEEEDELEADTYVDTGAFDDELMDTQGNASTNLNDNSTENGSESVSQGASDDSVVVTRNYLNEVSRAQSSVPGTTALLALVVYAVSWLLVI